MVSLQDLIKLLQRAEKAEELLHEIWLDVGPYNEKKLSRETLNKLNRWFDFDDSE